MDENSGAGQWHSDQEDHGRAVHSEEAVINLGTEEMVVWKRELNPNEKSFGAADQQEERRVENVEYTEALMIDCHYPRMKSLRKCSLRSIRNDGLDQFRMREWIIAHVTGLSSLQGLEISSQLIELLIVKLHCRHKGSPLERVRSLYPLPEVLWSVVRRTGGQCRPAHQVS
jgi:hypothetical protein